MKPLLFALPGNETLTDQLAKKTPAEIGQLILREFPDGESYVRILTEVKKRNVILVCTLFRPDDKFLSLWFLSKALKAQGAKKIILLAPYLAYMRQDKKFKSGESVSARHFAFLISRMVDKIITVDPHLHRINKLEDIYSIECNVLHAAIFISKWIKNNIEKPVLIGPDSESKQWVAEVAKNAGAPFIVLEKTRHGDRDVEVSVPQIKPYLNHTPVLVDDIISTARTMVRSVEHLINSGAKAPVCIGIHAVFAGDAFEALKNVGAGRIITCDTISHPSNEIALIDLYLEALTKNQT